MDAFQIVVVIVVFAVVPLWACTQAAKGDYPSRRMIERVLREKKK